MALSTENANLVWQKAAISLDSLGANKASREAIRVLKAYLSQEKRNLDLQFIAIDASTVDDTGGAILADAACKVYGVFLKKQATAVDTYLNLLDDATDDTGVTTDTRLSVGLVTASEQFVGLYPTGLAMGTGVVAKAYTEADGVTDAAAADTPNGFIIIGNP